MHTHCAAAPSFPPHYQQPTTSIMLHCKSFYSTQHAAMRMQQHLHSLLITGNLLHPSRHSINPPTLLNAHVATPSFSPHHQQLTISITTFHEPFPLHSTCHYVHAATPTFHSSSPATYCIHHIILWIFPPDVKLRLPILTYMYSVGYPLCQSPWLGIETLLLVFKANDTLPFSFRYGDPAILENDSFFPFIQV